MDIRRAEISDIPELNKMLYEVHKVHSDARPDIFREGLKKYSDEELKQLISDDERPIYVAVENGKAVGYTFLVYEYVTANALVNMKTLYIDDLCVEEAWRGQNIAYALYQNALKVARENGCSKVTLNVWSFNKRAMGFYLAVGMEPLKVVMEKVLE